MANITLYPMQDQFKTKLTQEYDWVSLWSIFVQETPTFTLPSGAKYCVVLSPNTSIQQAVVIDAFSTWAKTLNVSDASINKWPWLAYTQSTHPVGAEVIITDNFAHWEEMVSVINSKLDQTGWSVSDFDLSVTWSNWRIRKDGNDMKFRDDNQSEVTLSTIASAWADEKTKISVSDTTAWYLWAKLTTWDWLSKTIVSPWGDESIDLDIDLTDTTIFTATQVSGKVPLLNGSGRVTPFINSQADWSATSSELWMVEMATDAEATTGTDEERYINSKQLKNWAWFTWWYGGWVIARSDSETANITTDWVIKDIELTNIWGTISLSFDGIGTSGTQYIRIYKNGVDTWLVTADLSSSYETYWFSDISVSANDNIQLYADIITWWTFLKVKNFRILATPIPNYWTPTVVL